MTDLAKLNDEERDGRIRVVRRFYELLAAKDIDAWGELWHDEAKIIVPYPVSGFPSLIEGKATIVSGFHALFENFESFESELTGVYPAADSDAVCVEYRNRATLIGGTQYTNDNSRTAPVGSDRTGTGSRGPRSPTATICLNSPMPSAAGRPMATSAAHGPPVK